jgi:hypothetical protein
MWIVDEDGKHYMELTKADVDRMGSQVDASMAMVQEQLKSLPAEQRAQVEAMLRSQRGGMGAMPGPAARTEYRRTGADRVGKWPCTKYEGYRNDRKVVELCTVDPQALGVTAADFAVSRQMADFLRSLMPADADDVFHLGTPEKQGFSGVPVRRVSGERVTEVLEVSRRSFPDSLFTVPPGYERRELPEVPAMPAAPRR